MKYYAKLESFNKNYETYCKEVLELYRFASDGYIHKVQETWRDKVEIIKNDKSPQITFYCDKEKIKIAMYILKRYGPNLILCDKDGNE